MHSTLPGNMCPYDSGRRRAGSPQVFVREAGLGAVLVGLLLAVAGQQSLGNSLSPFPAPRKADDHALITDGVYQYTRSLCLRLYLFWGAPGL